LTKTIKLLSN